MSETLQILLVTSEALAAPAMHGMKHLTLLCAAVCNDVDNTLRGSAWSRFRRTYLCFTEINLHIKTMKGNVILHLFWVSSAFLWVSKKEKHGWLKFSHQIQVQFFSVNTKNVTDVDENVRLFAVIVHWSHKFFSLAPDCAAFPSTQEPVLPLDHNLLAEVWSGQSLVRLWAGRAETNQSHSLTSVRVSVCWIIEESLSVCKLVQIGLNGKITMLKKINKDKIHKKSCTQRK